MKNEEMEKKLNKVENYLYEIGQLAEQIKGKYEFSAELPNLEQMAELAGIAKKEIAEARNPDGQ